MGLLDVATGILIALGCFFIIVAAVGVVRFPDVYSRVHPAGKGDTLGQSLILVGLMLQTGFTFTSLKIVLILAFIAVANPTATHAVVRAAYTAGVKHWEKGDKRS